MYTYSKLNYLSDFSHTNDGGEQDNTCVKDGMGIPPPKCAEHETTDVRCLG